MSNETDRAAQRADYDALRRRLPRTVHLEDLLDDDELPQGPWTFVVHAADPLPDVLAVLRDHGDFVLAVLAIDSRLKALAIAHSYPELPVFHNLDVAEIDLDTDPIGVLSKALNAESCIPPHLAAWRA